MQLTLETVLDDIALNIVGQVQKLSFRHADTGQNMVQVSVEVDIASVWILNVELNSINNCIRLFLGLIGFSLFGVVFVVDIDVVGGAFRGQKHIRYVIGSANISDVSEPADHGSVIGLIGSADALHLGVKEHASSAGPEGFADFIEIGL